MLTKGQAAGGGGTLIAGSGALGATILQEKEGGGMPSEWTLLVSESDFSSKYSDNDLIGKKIGWYLVGTYGIEKGKSKNNEKWWKWSYKNWKEDSEKGVTFSPEFAKEKIEYAYSSESSDTNNKALNKACESIYKEKIHEKINSVSGHTETYRRYQNLLRYCSPLGQIPISIYYLQEESRYQQPTNSYGSNTAKTQNFISVTSHANDFFWKLKDQEFFGIDNIEGSGKSIQASDSALLHKLYQDKNKSNRGSVKDICEKIYKTVEDENGSSTEKYSVFSNHCNLYIWHITTSSK